MNSQRHNPFSLLLRCGGAALVLGTATVACFGVAKADSTDDYPIPDRIIVTSCTAEQLLAAGRDYKPVYYERYMIDMHNKPLDIRQATKDKIRWFLSLVLPIAEPIRTVSTTTASTRCGLRGPTT